MERLLEMIYNFFAIIHTKSEKLSESAWILYRARSQNLSLAEYFDEEVYWSRTQRIKAERALEDLQEKVDKGGLSIYLQDPVDNP